MGIRLVDRIVAVTRRCDRASSNDILWANSSPEYGHAATLAT